MDEDTNFNPLSYRVVLGITTVVLLIVQYFSYTFNYWKRRNVPSIHPSKLFGNFSKLFRNKAPTAMISWELHNELKSQGHKYGGIYFLHSPVFIPVDPVYIKHILSTDFDYFSERGTYYNQRDDPLTAHLFNLPTEPWKILRGKLTPTFTSGKIRMMMNTMVQCSEDLIAALSKSVDTPIDINDFTIRYSLDIIGRTAFGIDCNSLKNPDDSFKKIADRVINPPTWIGIKSFLALISPNLLKIAQPTLMERDVRVFFMDMIKQTIDYREQNKVERNDFLQLLINMKNNDEKLGTNNAMKMTWKLAAAQAFVFFIAGFETSSMTLNLCMLELSQNLEIQNRVRAEIQKVLKENDGKLTYDGLNSMTYLDQVFQETLRKYPPLSFLNRTSTKKYNIPGTDVVIDKGTKVMVSLLGLHMDPEYFPDPEKFDPDRFSPENKAKIKPFTYMPFGDGQRVCIGLRFGKVKVKVCLVALLANFKWTLNSNTKLPINYRATSFVLSLQDRAYFNIEKIEENI